MWNFVVVWSSTFFIVNWKDKSDGLLVKPQINKVNLFRIVMIFV